MVEEAGKQEGLDRRYAAFISYRHVAADRIWAKWLVEALETFRTPRGLVRKGFAARIGLLYRDEDENPASAELGDQIDKALHASDALIVVASRSTPASRWIDREVARFQELGRGDRILVLLTDGEPAEAYPPSLLREPDREPIAADVRPRRDESQRLLKRRARLRLAAALLRCGFDDLYRRDGKRRLRRWILASALLLAAIMTGAGLYVVNEQAKERLRLDHAATRIVQDPDFDMYRERRGGAMFNALSRRGWPYATLPDRARETLGGAVRNGAISRLTFPNRAMPIVIEPWRGGALVGLSDGSLRAVAGSSAPILPAADCTGADLAFGHCAVTALDASGDRIAIGTNRGEAALIDESRRGAGPVRFRLSTQRIEAVAVLDGRTALAADASGALYRIALDGRADRLAVGGGSVAAFVHEPDGGLLVVRGSGRIERLSASGRLAPVAQYPGPVRSAAFIGNRFYLIRNASGSGSLEPILLEGTAEHATARTDRTPVYVEDSQEGVFFGLNGRQIVIGRGPYLRMFDVISRTQEEVGLEPQAFEQEAREIAFSFYGSVAASADGRWLYAVDQVRRALILIDLAELARINDMLRNSRTPRADLCRPDMSRAFAALGLPRSVCD